MLFDALFDVWVDPDSLRLTAKAVHSGRASADLIGRAIAPMPRGRAADRWVLSVQSPTLGTARAFLATATHGRTVDAVDPASLTTTYGEIASSALRQVRLSYRSAGHGTQPVRVELKMRTVFNLLGPLTNPAGAAVQLVGAPSAVAAELMAGALAELGLTRGFVVHGSDGLDEITTTGPTLAFEISAGRVTRRQLEPKDFGVPVATPEDLTGGDAAENRDIALGILDGEPGPKRDIVLVNASAALVAFGAAGSFIDGVAMAARAIDSGGARAKLDSLRARSS